MRAGEGNETEKASPLTLDGENDAPLLLNRMVGVPVKYSVVVGADPNADADGE